MSRITEQTSVLEIVRFCPGARRIFDKYGLKGCGGERGPSEPLAFFARVHQVDLKPLLEELNAELQRPESEPYSYQESLADYIYRRFFKAGISIALSVGCLWGAMNLLSIALHKDFLQPRLLPSIQAHAHAMIFGWVGLFVMGFAYQSFPRFKFTTLWRPELANLSFYLMLMGIAMRVVAELILPAPVGLALGLAATAAEVTAITLFGVILIKTSKKSISKPNPYERFIFGAFAWFWIQSILSGVLFFAKATAGDENELIYRIALIDGPLRDIQVIGFAVLIIAGVSQRFVPVVYGLGHPKHDRQKLIFWLINFSLLLDVVSYVLLVSAGNFYFAFGLELSYLLMPVWAILLVRQLRVFATPSDRDRSLKFIRAAYGWLIFAMAMIPFFPAYSALTHQAFAHSFIGAYRHALTVGFISMMILGVSSRVVPILAGVDSTRVSSLWGPFILFNAGNAGRVFLQIVTDFAPRFAYSLIGWTGFIEVTALAWWAIDLWRTMNLASTHRSQVLRSPLPLPTA